MLCDYDFTPLDMALMLNNVEIITLLLVNGAKENNERRI